MTRPPSPDLVQWLRDDIAALRQDLADFRQETTGLRIAVADLRAQAKAQTRPCTDLTVHLDEHHEYTLTRRERWKANATIIAALIAATVSIVAIFRPAADPPKKTPPKSEQRQITP